MGFQTTCETEPAGDGVSADVERLVVHAARTIRPLAVLTPLGAASERVRLAHDLKARRPVHPQWRYAPYDHTELRLALDAAERRLARTATTRLGSLYLLRIRELAIEAALCAAAGTALVAQLAQERFGHAASSEYHDAGALCAAWLEEHASNADPCDERTVSDSDAPCSLLSRMRAEVHRLRLPFRVVATPCLASLAATGDGVVYVATDRKVTREETERTVLHEIEGHALPRTRALRSTSALFRAGTARGTDDQEGRALVIEKRAGLLGARRRHRLAARHRAVEMMLAGACYSDVAIELVTEHGLDETEAVLVGERAFRGGSGDHAGLGRERIYLEAFLRLSAHLVARPDDDRVLGCGQIALDAVDALRPFAA